VSFVLAAIAWLKGVPIKAWLVLGAVLTLAYAQWRVYDLGYDRGDAAGAARVQTRFDHYRHDVEAANRNALLDFLSRQAQADADATAATVAADARFAALERDNTDLRQRLRDHARDHPVPAGYRLDPDRVRLLNAAFGYRD